MPDKIDILESWISSEIFDLGMAIIDSDQPIEQVKEQNGLWIFKFPKDGVEVEILLKSGNRINYTCECDRFNKDGICEHIAAALILIRRLKLKQKQEREERKLLREQRVKNYTFKTILEQADKEDLQNFIHSYARKNKDFALAFKVHFASKTETGFEEQKFKKLLDEAVKPKSTRHPNLTRKELQNLKFLLNDFLAQVQDNISQEQYKDAFIIFEKCLDKIDYARIVYNKTNEAEITRLKDLLLKEFKLLLTKDLAPELKEQIKLTSIENASRSYVFLESFNYVSLVNKGIGYSESEKDELITDLVKKYQNKEILDQYSLALILELSSKNKTLKSKVFETFNALQIIDAMHLLQGNREIVLVDEFLKSKLIKESNLLERKMIEVEQYNIKRMVPEFLSAIEDIISSKNETKLTLKLISAISFKQYDNFKTEIQKFIDQLSSKNQCIIYGHYMQIEQLLLVLNDSLKLSLVVLYDELLLDNGQSKNVFELYKACFKHYLDEHIGTPSRDTIKSVFFHLTKIKANRLKMEISDFLTEQYPHRYTPNANFTSL